MRLYDRDRRFPAERPDQVGMGVEGDDLCDFPAADPANAVAAGGAGAVHGAMRQHDHHQRRHEDRIVGRRLWRVEPDGRQ